MSSFDKKHNFFYIKICVQIKILLAINLFKNRIDRIEEMVNFLRRSYTPYVNLREVNRILTGDIDKLRQELTRCGAALQVANECKNEIDKLKVSENNGLQKPVDDSDVQDVQPEIPEARPAPQDEPSAVIDDHLIVPIIQPEANVVLHIEDPSSVVMDDHSEDLDAPSVFFNDVSEVQGAASVAPESESSVAEELDLPTSEFEIVVDSYIKLAPKPKVNERSDVINRQELYELDYEEIREFSLQDILFSDFDEAKSIASIRPVELNTILRHENHEEVCINFAFENDTIVLKMTGLLRDKQTRKLFVGKDYRAIKKCRWLLEAVEVEIGMNNLKVKWPANRHQTPRKIIIKTALLINYLVHLTKNGTRSLRLQQFLGLAVRNGENFLPSMNSIAWCFNRCMQVHAN